MATEQLTGESDAIEAIALSENTEHSDSILLQDLGEVIFKLRAFMESASGEYALGVETGMQRAADMVENVVKRHGRGE